MTRYTQIEKEAVATTWTCERLSDHILGMKIHIETDHKPLVPLLGSKFLDSLPPRILCIHLWFMQFDYTISHVIGVTTSVKIIFENIKNRNRDR